MRAAYAIWVGIVFMAVFIGGLYGFALYVRDILRAFREHKRLWS